MKEMSTILKFFLMLIIAFGDGKVVNRRKLWLVDVEEQQQQVDDQLQQDDDLVERLIRLGGKKLHSMPKIVPGENGSFIVKARLYLIRIEKIDEVEETFQAAIRLQLNWLDPSLVWEPGLYGGLTEAVVPAGKLWIPPLYIANSVGPSTEVTRITGQFPFRVKSNGEVWYHSTGTSSTRCQFDLTYYPFDYQRCLIIIESEIYQTTELKVVTRDDDVPGAVSFGMLAENEIWEVMRNHTVAASKIYKSGRSTSFSRVHFSIFMRRKPGFFVVTVVIPTMILAIITLLTYFVPIHYVDRPVQSVTTVLAVAIFQSTIVEKMPSSSESCLLSSYLTAVMCSSAITVLTTTICLAVVDSSEYITAPWGIPNVIRAISTSLKNASWRISIKRQADGMGGDMEEGSFDLNSIMGSSIAEVRNYHSPLSPRQHCPVKDNIHSESLVHINRATSLRRRFRTAAHQFGQNKATRLMKRRNAVPDIKKESRKPRATSEPGRRLLSKKKAWYIAYAVNWAGFFICLIATLTIPITAVINKSYDDAEFLRKFKNEYDSYFEASYYGAS